MPHKLTNSTPYKLESISRIQNSDIRRNIVLLYYAVTGCQSSMFKIVRKWKKNCIIEQAPWAETLPQLKDPRQGPLLSPSPYYTLLITDEKGRLWSDLNTGYSFFWRNPSDRKLFTTWNMFPWKGLQIRVTGRTKEVDRFLRGSKKANDRFIKHQWSVLHDFFLASLSCLKGGNKKRGVCSNNSGMKMWQELFAVMRQRNYEVRHVF